MADLCTLFSLGEFQLSGPHTAQRGSAVNDQLPVCCIVVWKHRQRDQTYNRGPDVGHKVKSVSIKMPP